MNRHSHKREASRNQKYWGPWIVFFFLEMLDVLVGNHPIFVSKKTIGQCPKVAETGLDDFESFMFIGSNRYRKGYS